jgi:hypothetical protein
MAPATYEELSELLLLERAEGQELRDANQRLNEIVIRLIKILADAVPRMEERHGRTVMEEVFKAHKRTEGKEMNPRAK